MYISDHNHCIAYCCLKESSRMLFFHFLYPLITDCVSKGCGRNIFLFSCVQRAFHFFPPHLEHDRFVMYVDRNK